MSVTWQWRPLVAVLLLAIVWPFLESAVAAEDQAVKSAMLGLASKKKKERQQAIEALVASKDKRLIEFFRSYRKGSFYVWTDANKNETVILCEQEKLIQKVDDPDVPDTVQMVTGFQSSNVYAFGYDENARDLFVQFLDDTGEKRSGPGLTCAYHNIPPHIFLDMQTASSKGEFVWDDETKLAPLFDPLTREPITRDDGKQIFLPVAELKKIRPKRPDRKMASEAITLLELILEEDVAKRKIAVKKLGDLRQFKHLEKLRKVAETDENEAVRFTARVGINLIRISGNIPDQSREDRLEAARELGDMCSARAISSMEDIIESLNKEMVSDQEALESLEETMKTLEQNSEEWTQAQEQKAALEAKRADAMGALEIYRTSVDQIESYQTKIRWTGYLFHGISRGSILILIALGLSVTFGLMKVINMAHGELMMLGAISTYAIQNFFMEYLPKGMFDWYFVVSLPVAFFVAAITGYLIELLVVRHLYGRPLDTLLATWGIGLLLIVTVSLRYGYVLGVNAPSWAQGGVEVVQDLNFPYSRIFLIVLCATCVLLVFLLMKFTKLGLMIRATTQNRAMAESLGVNTRRIDGYTFALGSGLAGIAGWGVTLVAGVTPDMGTNYIVDSFLVVVTGGVGEIAGVVCAGLGLGVADKLIEPSFGAVWGKVIILCGVVLFIQWRPSGLFAPKGRLADVE